MTPWPLRFKGFFVFRGPSCLYRWMVRICEAKNLISEMNPSPKKFALVSLVLVLFATEMGWAQDSGLVPPTGGDVEAARDQGEASAGGTAGVFKEPPSLFGIELPTFDPGSEVLSWNGKSWSVLNQRLFATRFERYLNSPESDSKEDRAYREVLRSILDELSPHQPGKGNLSKAVGLLPVASAYEQDSRLCESLSNTIYGIWLARRNVAALKKANKELEREMKRQLWNANISASDQPLRDKPRKVGSGSNNNNNNTNNNQQSNQRNNNNTNGTNGNGSPGNQIIGQLFPNAPGGTGSLDDGVSTGRRNFESASWAAYYLKKAAEYEAAAAKNKVTMSVSELQQKIEFQALILQFFMQRRFEHVIIATRLYRAFFKDGDNAMKFDQESSLYKSFQSGVGMTPTISTFDALANEAMRDVEEGVKAFEFLIEKDELESAARRLTEAFIVGEHLPRIRTLEREKKRRVLEFVRYSNQLISAIEIKNYHLAREIVEKLKVTAKDFDYAKAQGVIDTATLTADMLLKKAMLAARGGNDEEMQKNLQKAHELYPTNPELQKVSDLILKGSDTQSQALNDLDRLLAEGNYRAIQKEEARFAAAVGLSNDPKRLEDLMKVRETLKELEMRLEKAKALAEAGSQEAAWETLREGSNKFGQDPEFAQLYSDLTVKAAKFVHIIEEATRHRENDQLGSSLAWYLKARQMHMKSTLASKGIDEIVSQLLPKTSNLPPATAP